MDSDFTWKKPQVIISTYKSRKRERRHGDDLAAVPLSTASQPSGNKRKRKDSGSEDDQIGEIGNSKKSRVVLNGEQPRGRTETNISNLTSLRNCSKKRLQSPSTTNNVSSLPDLEVEMVLSRGMRKRKWEEDEGEDRSVQALPCLSEKQQGHSSSRRKKDRGNHKDSSLEKGRLEKERSTNPASPSDIEEEEIVTVRRTPIKRQTQKVNPPSPSKGTPKRNEERPVNGLAVKDLKNKQPKSIILGSPSSNALDASVDLPVRLVNEGLSSVKSKNTRSLTSQSRTKSTCTPLFDGPSTLKRTGSASSPKTSLSGTSKPTNKNGVDGLKKVRKREIVQDEDDATEEEPTTQIRSTTPSAHPELPNPPLSPAKNLSVMFDELMGSTHETNKNKPPTGAKVVQHMRLKKTNTVILSNPSSPEKEERTKVSGSLWHTKSLPVASSPAPVIENAGALKRQLSAPSTPTKFPHSPTRGPSVTIVPESRIIRTPLKRTYAGSRSFRDDLGTNDFEKQSSTTNSYISKRLAKNEDDSPISALKEMTSRLKVRETYSEMRQKWGIDLDQDDGITDEYYNVKSISELKSVGETKRFEDDLNYLLEGFKKEEQIGVKRTSAIEIVRKMGEPNFTRRLKASGGFEKVYRAFRLAGAGDGDKVLDPALVLFLCLVGTQVRSLETLLKIMPENSSTAGGLPDILVVVSSVLNRPWASDELGGGLGSSKILGKTEKKLQLSIRDIIAQSSSSHLHVDVISLRFLCLATLAPLVASRSNDNETLSFVSTTCLFHVLEGLVNDFVAISKSNISRSRISLLSNTEFALQIAEACITFTDSASEVFDHYLSSLPKAAELFLVAAYFLASDKDERVSASALECIFSTLKVLISLTTSKPDWSSELGSCRDIIPILIRFLASCQTQDNNVEPNAKSKVEAAKFDLMCLCLCLLSNLVEADSSCKSNLLKFSLDKTCKEPDCIPNCTCEDSKPNIHILTTLYLEQVRRSAENEDASFVATYAGLLLGLAMLDEPKIHEVVMRDLSQDEEVVNALRQSMEEMNAKKRVRVDTSNTMIQVENDS